MSFNSIGFLIFLPVTVIVNYILPHKARWVWLLAASYFFYMSWEPKMAALIFAVTLVAYLGGLAAGYFRDKKGSPKGAGASAAIACVLCLAALIFFKYFGFLMENVNRLIALGGGEALSIPDILLPVGISFFTFQAIGYVIDVARGKIAAEKHFGYFTLFVSFFPQLVAGPIERADALMPQLKTEHKLKKENIFNGLGLIIVGFFKKIAVADMLAGPVNAIFDDPEKAGSGLAALGAAMFAVQIFCDFSGYTDIAKGSAELLGIRLSKNFDKPYAAVSINDFWRRWHISLSGWFREYIYFPLGGSRRGEFRTCINLMVVFLVSGLWHGAAWHFVVWGVLHGLFCVIDRVTLKPRNRFWEKLKVKPDGAAILTVRRILTFLVVCFLWIFFRASNIAEAWNVIKVIFSFKAGSAEGIFTSVAAAVVAAASTAVLLLIDSGRVELSLPMSESALKNNKGVRKLISPAAIVIMTWTVIWAWLFLSSTSAGSAFIYFQF